MNYYSNDLVRARLDDFRREAEHASRVREARRASKLAAARSASASSWKVARRMPAVLAAAVHAIGG